MSVEIKPTSTIIADLGLKKGGPVHKFFTDTCYRAMDPYVPKDKGFLRSVVSFSTDGSYIIYEVPYARYQYYGKKMVMSNGKSAFYNPDYGFWSKKGEKKIVTDQDLVYHSAGTGPYWDKRMWNVDKDWVIKQVERYIKKGAK